MATLTLGSGAAGVYTATTLAGKVAALNTALGTSPILRIKQGITTVAQVTLATNPVSASGQYAVLAVPAGGTVSAVATITSSNTTAEVLTSGGTSVISGFSVFGPSESFTTPATTPGMQFSRNFQRVGQALGAFSVILWCQGVAPVATTYSVRVSSGSAVTNTPLSFVATFMPGEIANYPNIRVAGATPTYQQSTVLTRWTDGSVQDAVIAAQVDAPAAASSVSTITFVNNVNPSGAGIGKSGMLAALTSGTWEGSTDSFATVLTTWNLDYRALISSDKYDLFYEGPACTCIRINDTSGASDVGLDANKSVRPWVWLRFWQTGTVEIICQEVNGKTNAIQTLRDHKVRIKANGSTLYTSATSYLPPGASAATPPVYVGATPATLDLDLNATVQAQTGNMMAYQSGTLATANRDQQRTDWSSIAAASRERFSGFAAWLPQMSSVAGRKDFAPQPGFYTVPLFTGGANVDADQMLAMAHHALKWPTPWRIETNAANNFDTGVNGLGKFVTTIGRPTISSGSNDQFYTFTTTGTTDNTGVTSPIALLGWDMAHAPNPFQMPWLYTAHPMWLVAMQAWAIRCTTSGIPDTTDVSGRGPTQQSMSIWAYPNNERQMGWGVQAIANAYRHSVDGSVEKALLKKAMEDCLIRNVVGHGLSVPTAYTSHPMVAWATTNSAWKVNGGSVIDGSAMRDITSGASDADPNFKVNTPFMTAFCEFPHWLIYKRQHGDLSTLAKTYFDWQVGQNISMANSTRPKIGGSYEINIYANAGSGVSGAPRYLTSWEERYVQSGSIDLDTLWASRLVGAYQEVGGYSRFQLGVLDLGMRLPGGLQAWLALSPTEVTVNFPSWKWATGGM